MTRPNSLPKIDPAVSSIEFPASYPGPAAVGDQPCILHEYELVTLAGEVLCHERRTPYESVTENLEAMRTGEPRRWIRED